MAITITLEPDEALVLFELVASEKLSKSVDEAERSALWGLESALEKVLEEPFSAQYKELLESARESLIERYGHEEPVTKPRRTSKAELDEVVAYWRECPRCSGHYEEGSLIQFLEIFTPHQIKGAMYLATSSGRPNYFRYLCGILHNWRRDLEAGVEPRYFDIGEG